MPRPAKPEGEAPRGWQVHFSNTFKRWYYWCERTDDKCWSLPECQAKEAEISAKATDQAAPAAKRKRVDEAAARSCPGSPARPPGRLPFCAPARPPVGSPPAPRTGRLARGAKKGAATGGGGMGGR